MRDGRKEYTLTISGVKDAWDVQLDGKGYHLKIANQGKNQMTFLIEGRLQSVSYHFGNNRVYIWMKASFQVKFSEVSQVSEWALPIIGCS
jgi:hypothetical protein